MKRRLAVLLVAALAIAGVSVAPALSANAAGGTTKGTIRVQLQNQNGSNFSKSGFVVSASGLKENVYVEAVTNKQGWADLRVPPSTPYTLTVVTYRSDYRYALNSTGPIGIQRGQHKTIGITMKLGAIVKGKVTKPGGGALKNAMVAAINSKGILVGLTTADSKGKYALRGLPTGKLRIMFNQRSWADPKKATVRDWGWSFYKGGSYDGLTLQGAKPIHVYAQNKYAAATETHGINGTVRVGTQLTVGLTTPTTSKGRLLVNRTSAAGKYIAVESVYAPFSAGTSATLKVEPGRYRLGVNFGTKTDYFYTGDGNKLTTNAAKAVFVNFTDQPLTVTFGPK